MYAQRMSSLPIARETGGLADTIEDGVTGFLFRDASLPAMLGAIYRAVDAYGSRRKLPRDAPRRDGPELRLDALRGGVRGGVRAGEGEACRAPVGSPAILTQSLDATRDRSLT